ncbi:hypothetical protein ACJ41O_003711 [Fusarium nematophilum]
MSSSWSDDLSTVCGSTWQPMEEQIKCMEKAIAAERGSNDLAIIAVVSDESVNDMAKKSKKRWWQFWKGSSMVLVSTSEWLQEAIREVHHDGRRRSMIIMASTGVQRIRFKVRSSIDTLKILRCGHHDDPEGRLIVSGSATLKGVRLDEWQDFSHKEKKVFLGKGVYIKIDSDRASSWFESTESLSQRQRAKVHDYLGRMRNTRMTGTWWEEWKGLIAGILGVSATSVKLAAGLKASAGGFFFNFKTFATSFQAGAFKASLSSIATAAGPAVLLGAGVAACVYFVPWEDVFTWLRGAFATIWDWFTALWDKFRSYMETLINRRKIRAGYACS